MRLVRAFAWFWWELVIGDDWRIAAYVLAVLGAAALLAVNGVAGPVVAIAALLGLMGCFAVFLWRDASR
jgi:hypothetical protein